MKKNTLALLAVGLFFIAIGGIGAALTYQKAFDSVHFDHQETVAVEDIQNLSITGTSAAVYLTKTNAKEISVNVEGLNADSKVYTLDSNKNSETLHLNINEMEQSSNTILDYLNTGIVRVTIEIPDSIETLSLSTETGTVSISHLTLSALSIKTDVGSIDINDSQLDQLNVKNTAGVTDITQSIFQQLTIDSDAGSANLTKVVADETEITTDVGQIDFSQVTGKLTAQTNAGAIVLSNPTIDQDVTLTTNFGTITVLTENTPENLTIETSHQLGEVSLFDKAESKALFGNGTHLMKLTTDTGTISVSTAPDEEYTSEYN
ncbi:DUF4097 family beta strand repeat-containing protein [Carnobacterium antarcticum]|uniref:DUF4097 family beta strand repeat-containing protein n=1 Tax=Carnobacterium antarcticum TaxID=2126436 RepID=A0ABW4NJW7_9LACT|nr:DUF4097 family beta strand repeat-containing protein [Carnobacterium sp. CP1]ALV22861.1 hypothetical protein NY10_2276 [Carnobacterium sp. CP1]